MNYELLGRTNQGAPSFLLTLAACLYEVMYMMCKEAFFSQKHLQICVRKLAQNHTGL